MDERKKKMIKKERKMKSRRKSHGIIKMEKTRGRRIRTGQTPKSVAEINNKL